MRRISFAVTILLAGAALAMTGQTGSAQSYSRGQNISPAFEGWEENTDGVFFLRAESERTRGGR